MNNYYRLITVTLRIVILLMLGLSSASAQPGGSGRSGVQSSRSGQSSSQRDSTAIIPRGLTTWRVDERFGSITPTVPDTVAHLFMNSNLMEGSRAGYNHTGNIGAPRIARIYNGQQDYAMGSQFIFIRPYDVALGSVSDCVFTNTKSPITNLSWYSQGNKLVGDDRLRVNFATNINKDAGIGFKVDYLYGRGYYEHQQQSSVASKLFGSYRGDRYQIHGAYVFDRTRNAENGGLSDDTYITHPEYYSTKYAPADMPVRLTRAYNRMKVNTLFLTHRYNLGFYQAFDHNGELISMAKAVTDSDSIAVKALLADSTIVRKFIPVAGFIHTAKLDHSWHSYIDNSSSRGYYYNDFFAGNDSIDDKTRYFAVENTFALEMSEGFKKWVKTGMRLYARHQLQRFALLDEERRMNWDTYNYITVGAQLMKEQGHLFHYNVLGELRTTGADWGEFNIEGNLRFDVPVRRDTISLCVDGYVRNETPLYYYRHYHGAAAWWDNTSFSNVFRSRVNGMLSWRKTRVKVAFETIQNYTFFQEIQSMNTSDVIIPAGKEPDYSVSGVHYGVMAKQADKNIQVLSAALCQDLKFGPVVWENEWTFQQTSDSQVLPLPKLNVWSNLYLHFYVAKVLRTDIGADVRYFTKYDAPAYSPLIGQYAVQDTDHRVQIGNYPWINVYANFHLKTCRFFVMMSHVNCRAGNYFLAPHYPTNQRTFRLGISWNFFN